MPVALNIEFDLSQLQKRFELEEKQFVSGVAQAINKTGLEVQIAERANLDRQFHLRNVQFMYRLIKIFSFASPSKGRPFLDIGIDNTKQRLLLPEFEVGGPRDPFVGKNVALPVFGSPTRLTVSSAVPGRLTFQRLQFQRAASGRLEGKQKTYIIPGVGVFMRTGKGKARQNSKLIYAFRSNLKIAPSLHFGQIAADKFQATFEGYFFKIFDAGSR